MGGPAPERTRLVVRGEWASDAGQSCLRVWLARLDAALQNMAWCGHTPVAGYTVAEHGIRPPGVSEKISNTRQWSKGASYPVFPPHTEAVARCPWQTCLVAIGNLGYTIAILLSSPALERLHLTAELPLIIRAMGVFCIVSFV